MADHPRVFISYARNDGEAFATRLRQRLEQEHPEITLWQDRARMEGGVGWWNQITEALDKVRFMVLMMTPAALASPIVQKEWRYARQQGVCVYPVKGVHDTQLDFRMMPTWMSSVHVFDLEKEWETFVNHLKSDRRPPRVPFMAPDLPAGFVERPREFDQLRALLLDSDRKDPVAITTALQGAGGFGKTTLAAALCHDEDVITAFRDGILWTTLGEQPNVLDGLAKLHAALTGEDPGFRDAEQAAQRLADRLDNRCALLVIDDVWNDAHLSPYLRGGKGCARLITTRQRTIAVRARCRAVTVDEMATDEAILMLTAKLDAIPPDREPFRTLAERLGAWPLMIDLIGGALQERVALGDSVAGALEYVNWGLDEEGVSAFRRDDADERHQSIARALEVSLKLLSAEDRRHYHELAIFAEDVDVPLSALQRIWDLKPFPTAALAQRLGNLSLLRYDLEAGTIRLHNVIRTYLAKQLDTVAVHARLVDAWGDPHCLPDAFAWRWLAFHLIGANRAERLRELLLEFAWIRAKLQVTDLNALLADYAQLGDDADMGLMQGALRLSAHVVTEDSDQLSGQLLGRLIGLGSPALQVWLTQANAGFARPWLRPLKPCLTAPGGALLRIFNCAGLINSMCVTSDGCHAVSTNDRTLSFWDFDSGLVVHRLEGHEGRITAVAVTPDGCHAVSASYDRTLRFWNLGDGTELRQLMGHGDGVTAVAVTPDGLHAISASADKTLRFWDLDTGAELLRFASPVRWVNAVAVTPDGRRAVSAAEDGTLSIWDCGTGAELRRLKGHAGGFDAMEMTPDGREVRAVAVTPDGHSAVSASWDRTLRLWDLDTGAEIHRFEGHTGGVNAVVVTPDGRRAVSASYDGTLRLWDLDTGAEIHRFEGHTGGILTLAMTPDGRRAVSASNDRTLRLWDLGGGLGLRHLEDHASGVTSVAMTPDGRRAVSASYDGTLRLWDLGSGVELRRLEGHTSGVTSVAMTPDGRRAVSASYDGTLRLWDLGSGVELRCLKGNTGGVAAVAVTPDAYRVVSIAADGSRRFWQPDSGVEQRHLEEDAKWVRAMAVTPDALHAVYASYDRSLRVRDLETGAELSCLEVHAGVVTAVAITPDRRRAVVAVTPDRRPADSTAGNVVSATDDGTLRVWDLETGAELRCLKTHADRVNAVAVTPDGRRALSAADRTLRLWDLDCGHVVAGFDGDSPFQACAIGPDGRTIVGGDAAGRIHILCLEGA
jgi:WD40 repeat protein